MQDYEALTIATGDGRYSLELVPAYGGVTNALIHTDAKDVRTALVAGHHCRADFELDRYYHNVPLYPFVNRLKDGLYSHANNRYQFELNEPGRANALHGFLFKRRPRVERERRSESEAEITLVWRYGGDVAAYPFMSDIRLRFHLHSEEGLSLTFTVKNLHHQSAPLAIGWHPYFTLGGLVDDLCLQLPPCNRVEVDQRLLPTGTVRRFDKFDQATAIGNLELDDCMELLPSVQERVSTLLLSPLTGLGVEVWQIANEYPCVQVFIPPGRRSIAIEPVSGGINCFNTQRHLRVLAPGETFTAHCGVRLVRAGG